MDIGHFYSPPTELYSIQVRQQASIKAKQNSASSVKVRASARSGDTVKAMTDNKGWRKKIGSKSKEPLSLKTGPEDIAAIALTEAVSQQNDRRRHGWRKTTAARKSLTPTAKTPTTPTPDDLEDTRTERSEVSTSRRGSRPNLARYTSLFAAPKEEPTSSIFSEPWSVNSLPDQGDPWSYIDPLVIMESIHSHICKNYMMPISVQHTSGLFQIFDDHRKLRSQKELLETREREALQHSRNVTAKWLESEELYESEIRRLELIIARGNSGMTGLAQARQGTLVDRKRQHRKTISTDRILPRYQRMSLVEIDAMVKEKKQKVFLHRPMSPSGAMTALSRQLANGGTTDLSVGTPPTTHRDLTFSRKVKSELDLLNLHPENTSRPVSDANTAGQSTPTPDASQNGTEEADQLLDSVLKRGAFAALRELGTLIARRRGLDVADFVGRLVALLASADAAKPSTQPAASDDRTQNYVTGEDAQVCPNDKTPRPPSRIPRSQSFQEINQKKRRHFSFEPGDDQLRALGADPTTSGSPSQSNSTESELSSSADFDLFDDELESSDDESALLLSLGADLAKPSLIPSPVQTSGRIRRENSISSLQSRFNESIQDGRRNSRTSIQTAFREASGADTSTRSKSRDGSNHTLCAAESSLGSKERLKCLANRQSTTALAAARAAESKSRIVSASNTQLCTATSAPQKRHGTAHQRTENTDPNTSSNAG